ncbi:MAG: septum formation protein Maf [bacterium]|nr:MAG: septum formation protein Maf [bacterium]
MKFITLLCDLEHKKIVLASQSPRRIELLRSVGLEFEIYPPRIEEKSLPGFSPEDHVCHVASEKAHWVAKHVNYDMIIAADTIVTLDGHIFEKPSGHRQAEQMLKELSDRTHDVITGFCLLTPEEKVIDYEKTRVTFYKLSDSEIEMYLNSDEPFDKAGAYGIQGFASLFIRQLEGCYFNVVGFPLGKFYQHLKKLDI